MLKPASATRGARSLCTLMLLTLVACGDPSPGDGADAGDPGEPAPTPGDVVVAPKAPPAARTEAPPTVAEPATAEVAEEPAEIQPTAGAPTVAAEPPADAGDSAATPSEPRIHEVRGVVTQWRPMILFAQPGDTVVFRQMSGHDTETIEGLYPAKATAWKSSLGEEGYSVTLTEPGAYIYKCNPHVSTGMVAAIVVGEVPPANLAELEANPQNKGMIGRAIRKLKQALDTASAIP